MTARKNSPDATLAVTIMRLGLADLHRGRPMDYRCFLLHPIALDIPALQRAAMSECLTS